MKIDINPDGIWYHGSNCVFTELRENITDIIFVRHAQSVYGEDDRNRPLSEDGLKDRQIVLDVLKDRKIDAFLCSPYKRSIDTINRHPIILVQR